MQRASDVLVIGGGIMGCASALALAERGVSVTVLERSVPGAEASSAAAGILGAQGEVHADGPLARLCLESRRMYGEWVARIEERTRIDVGYRECGVVHVAFDAAELDRLEAPVAWQREAGLPVERLDAAAVRELEPALVDRVHGALRFRGDARVDPPQLLKALRIAAEQAGARFRSGSMVRRIAVEGGRATGVVLEDATLSAAQVVLAAGSWSSLVEGASLPSDAVRPARGQIVELTLPSPVVQAVIYAARCYLSPRDDGRVLVGSTLELVGFRRGVTAKAIRDLLDAAIDLVPALAEADVSRTWSSFRPYTANELPMLGRGPIEGLLLATGHFRNGILLAPVSADIVTALALGETPRLDLTAFEPSRA